MMEVLQTYPRLNKNNRDDHEVDIVDKHDAFNYEDKKEKLRLILNLIQICNRQ